MRDRSGERALPALRGSDDILRATAKGQPPRERGAPASAALSGCVLAVARGSDHAAFAVLFSHFAPRLKTYFVLSGLPDATAEELTQETMVLVWRKAGRFDPEKAAASTWIFAIARNVRTDFLRRGQHLPAPQGQTLDEAPHPSERDISPGAEELIAAAQREERLRHALCELPPEQAEVLRLSYFGDRSHSDIGRALGIPLGTVKGRLRLAVTRLRAALVGSGP